MAPSDELEALAKRHGALSYRNRRHAEPGLRVFCGRDWKTCWPKCANRTMR